MFQVSCRRLFTAFLLSFAAYFFLDGTLAAIQNPQTPEGSPAQASPAPAKDRSQWRKLHRHMPKDEVKNLLGEPDTVSVSRFSEVWNYPRGSVTFDGKGHLDMWTEY